MRRYYTAVEEQKANYSVELIDVAYPGRIREPGSKNVEEGRKRDQSEEREVKRELPQLRDGQDTVGMQRPMTKQDGEVTRVCDGGEEQGAETLVQLEGKVRRTGDQGGEQGQVWVAVVHNAAQNTVDECNDGKKVEGSIDRIPTTPWKKF